MDAKAKPWGTIFLSAEKETTLDNLEAMQAPLEQERRAREAEQAYLERVRAKAVERAREVLAEAYAERQRLLDEAAEQARPIHAEAAALREEAAALREAARQDRAAAEGQLLAAKAERDAGHEAGFAHGMALAQDELVHVRSEIGASAAWLLHAIHGACGQIFEGWRQELAELCTLCVEKGTALVLEERHTEVLERLLVDAARRMEQRETLTLRVNPEDEAAANDMLLAAREQLPRLEQWMIVGDASVQRGGLVAETPSGAVDSRLELRRELVDSILRHLTLPETPLDHAAQAAVDIAWRAAADHVAAIAPSVTPPAVPDTPNTASDAAPAPAQELDAAPEATTPQPAADAAPPHDTPADDGAHDAVPYDTESLDVLIPDATMHDAPQATPDMRVSAMDIMQANVAAAAAAHEGDIMAEAALPEVFVLPDMPEMALEPAHEPAYEPVQEFVPVADAPPATQPTDALAHEAAPLAPATDLVPAPAANATPPPANTPARAPTLAELEDELLPMPEHDDAEEPVVPDALHSALTTGGFLDDAHNPYMKGEAGKS